MSSRRVKSDTAITRLAARSTVGTTWGLYVRVQRLNASGCRRIARSWTVTTSGTRERSGPRYVGQCRTSAAPSRPIRNGYQMPSRANVDRRLLPPNERAETVTSSRRSSSRIRPFRYRAVPARV